MRKIAFVGLIVGLLSFSAFAGETDHPKAEFYGGYQYTRVSVAGTGINFNGFNFGATGNFNNYFGITGDFGASFKSENGASLHNYTYTFGPQLALRANKGFTPFVHALIGGDRMTFGLTGVGSGSGNGWAMLAGGGVDVNMNQYAAIRVGADWMMLHGSGETFNKNFRMPVGIVFKF